MDYDKLLKLIDVVEKSSLTKFSYKEGETKIVFEKNTQVVSILDSKYDELTNIGEDKLDFKENDMDLNEYEYIKSPLVGTFYECPSPNEEAFVFIGQKIEVGQTLGIIEAMKIMNEVKSSINGVVEEILVKNNDTVEYGQKIIKIKKG
ncbi:MAG: acetyl-CoA carboxylase biotin carboxyl carrier protein [Peptostreptococcaceae bacterium]